MQLLREIMDRVPSKRIGHCVDCYRDVGKERGEIVLKGETGWVLLNKIPPDLCHSLTALWGGDFILLKKIEIFVVEKWLSMDVMNTRFATRHPRFRFSLCHICASHNSRASCLISLCLFPWRWLYMLAGKMKWKEATRGKSLEKNLAEREGSANVYSFLCILFFKISLLLFVLFCFVFGCGVTCGILLPWPGIQPVSPTLEARSPNHWTPREVSNACSAYSFLSFVLLLNIYYLFLFMGTWPWQK